MLELKSHSINSKAERNEIKIHFQHQEYIKGNRAMNSKLAIPGVCSASIHPQRALQLLARACIMNKLGDQFTVLC